MLAQLEKEKFGEYISVLPIDTISSLSKALCGNEVDVSEFPLRCADIFTEILKECANGAKKVVSIWKMAKSFSCEASDTLVPDLTEHLHTIPKSDLFLLEASSLCPLAENP